MNKKLIVVVGAGPGVGNHVAKKFGANDFKVVLVSRNQSALDQYTEELSNEGVEAHSVVADASNLESLTAAFDLIKRELGVIDVLLYNAFLPEAGTPSSLTAESLSKHLDVGVTGALHSALQVIPDQMAQKSGALLFTGGGFALYPSVDYAGISLAKAGIRILALTLAEELKPKGIFVGTVTIGGVVAPGTKWAPEIIAEKFWELYEKREEHEIFY